MARPQKQGLKTKNCTFRITQELDDIIEEIVREQYLGAVDKSHVIRLALEDYSNTYYKNVV